MKKTAYVPGKRNFIRDFIIENDHYTTPSLTIAKIAVNKFPDIFGDNTPENVDKARTLVRNLRGSCNSKGWKPDSLLESRFHGFTPTLNDFKPFIIPEEIKCLGVVGDIHIPYMDEKNVNAALDWLEEHKIDALLINGDLWDCYQLSSFTKDRRMRSTYQEIIFVREFLDMLSQRFKKVYYKLGNHEERLENFVFKQAPEFIEFMSFEKALENNGEFSLKEYGIEIIKDKRPVMFTSNLTILHGHEFGKSFSNPVGAARWLYMKAKANAMCNHVHTSSEFSARTVAGKQIKTWSIGALCDMNPGYRPLNDWQAGFAMIKRDGEYFKVTNLTMENGRVY
jgi:predicted phosphodiesterase